MSENTSTTSAFSYETLIGMAKEAALAAVKAAGLTCRVVREDDNEFMRTMEVNDKRVNLTVAKGVVEKADLG